MAKYKSKRIGEMSIDELVLHGKGIMIKTCIITGWQIPENQEYVTVFEDQLRKLLVDEYQDINIDEYEYAMRRYGTQIKDWGKSINLSLIREPLDEYKSYRSELSKVEEQNILTPEIEGPKDADWSDTWERLIKGEIMGLYADLIPYPSLYDWLVKNRLYEPTKGIKWECMDKARSKFIGEVALKRETFQATTEEKELAEMMKVPTWHKNERVTSALIAQSKTIAVKELINLKINENTNSL